jgi:hypothetical protein
MEALGVCAATFVPWLFGIAICRCLTAIRALHPALQLAHGYMLGFLACSLIIRSWNLVGWRIEFAPITVIMCLACGLLWFLQRQFGGTEDPGDYHHRSVSQNLTKGFCRTSLPLALTCLCLALLIAWRFYAIALEALVRPLFAWDAWAAWTPRTLLFFEARALEASYQTIKDSHGIFTNIVHFWAMLGADTTETTLAALPWLGAGAAIILGTYGWLRSASVSWQLALITCYAQISLPFLAIHSMLAGYADIWLTLAVFLGLSCCATLKLHHQWQIGLLAIGYALLCATIKQAGYGAMLIILGCLIHVTLTRQRSIYSAVIPTLAISVSIVVAMVPGSGVDLNVPLPGAQRLIISGDEFALTGFIRIGVESYQGIGAYLFESLFIFPNWNLLFATACLLFFWRIANADLVTTARDPAPLAILLGLLYTSLFHGLAAPQAAMGHQGLSRSMLYFVPSMVCWMGFIVSEGLREAASRAKSIGCAQKEHSG